MKITKASEKQLDTVMNIVSATISEIYPRHYTQSQTDFFLAHHSKEKIISDIAAGCVYILDSDGAVGTVTVKSNGVYRLFVLPAFQGRGYGGALMNFAEQLIADEYDSVKLDSSVPAFGMYVKRGYTVTAEVDYDIGNGNTLHYQEMQLVFPQEETDE